MVRNNHDELDAGNGYAAQLETLRSATKWLLTAAAGIGALLAAGLQLTGIGRLPVDSWRLYAALGAATVTLASIGYVIKVTAAVLTEEWLTLAHFSDESGGIPDARGKRPHDSSDLLRIEEQLSDSRHELFGHAAPSLPELHRKLHESHRTIWDTDLDEEERRHAARTSNELRRTARAVVQAANYYHTRFQFDRLRVRLARAAVIGLVGIIAFAYVVSPPPAPTPIDVRIVSLN